MFPRALPLQMEPTPVYALLRRQTTTGTPHVEINLQDLQVVQTANTSDWSERQWTPEAWNGTKTTPATGANGTCYLLPPGGGRALTFQH